MRRIGLVLVVLALVGAAPTASEAFSRCGNVISKKSGGPFIGRIHASGMDCREARWVVRRFHNLGGGINESTFRTVTDDDGYVIRVVYRYRGRWWQPLDYSLRKQRYELAANELRFGRRRITWRTAV